MKETNMEHFRCEMENLLELDDEDELFAVVNGRPVLCFEQERCIGCELKGKPGDCAKSFIKWLMSEYKPEPVLTAREKHFVECLEDGWLTKGEACNEFKWWEKKPRRERNKWVAYEATQVHSILSYAFGIKLPFITWEDEEPWSVEDLRKLKVGETDGC